MTSPIPGQSEPITLESMRADIAEIIALEIEEIQDDDSLIDLGLDSMRMMGLVVKWGATGIPLEFSDLAEHVTLDQWWKIIQQLQARNAE